VNSADNAALSARYIALQNMFAALATPLALVGHMVMMAPFRAVGQDAPAGVPIFT
jgi:hypothetical protein